MKDYTKKQKILIILGVSLFILIGSGLTYAALTWATSNPINIGLTSGCFEINYTPGGAINNANVEVMNESTLISNNKFTITEGIALTYANIGIKSTCSIEGYGSLYLNVTSLSSAFSTGSSKGSLKYAILNNTSSSTTLTVAGLKGQSFDIVKKGIITAVGKKFIVLDTGLKKEDLTNGLIYCSESKFATSEQDPLDSKLFLTYKNYSSNKYDIYLDMNKVIGFELRTSRLGNS